MLDIHEGRNIRKEESRKGDVQLKQNNIVFDIQEGRNIGGKQRRKEGMNTEK